MIGEKHLLFWLNTEIPNWLNKYNTYEEFLKDLPSAAASGNFKAIAWAMAKERWNIQDDKEVFQC